MLKVLPTYNFGIQTTKCGEIFCHNLTDFTVYCTFCEIKTFSFEDFLQHVKNVHFSKELCKSEAEDQELNYFDGLSNVICKLEDEEKNICDGIEKSYHDDSNHKDVENDIEYVKDFSDKYYSDNSKVKEVKYSNSGKAHKDCDKFKPEERYIPAPHLNPITDEQPLAVAFKKKEKFSKQISCEECGKIFFLKKSLYSHIVEYHLGFKCTICDKRFKYLQQRDRHEYGHTAEKVFSCDIDGCDKSFTHKYYLQRHIDSHNKERKFVCDFENCTKAFHTLRCLKAHKNRHTKPKNLICDTCGYTFREYDRLRKHQRVHNGEKPYRRKKCVKRSLSNVALEHSESNTDIHATVNTETGSHTLKNEQNKSTAAVGDTLSSSMKKSKISEYTCTECCEIFSQKKCLDQHVQELHNGYKCPLCDKRFMRSSQVDCHLRIHNNVKTFICPIENCGKGFVDEKYLKRHLEVHTMERNFICEYENCGKMFQTKRRLSSHIYKHKIPKKFVCDVCGFRCRFNSVFINHQRIHTGDKPFSCEVCSKRFISKTSLREHKSTHSEIRPHICSICKKGFSDRRVLVRHTYIHSDEKTFKCKLCESAFKHPNSLQGHMRYVHREPKIKTVKLLCT